MSSHIRLNGQIKPDLPSTHYLDNRIYSDETIYERERDEHFWNTMEVCLSRNRVAEC